MTKEQRNIKRKLPVLVHAKETGNVSKTCRYYGISRQIFYKWKRVYSRFDKQALINSEPFLENLSLWTSYEIEKKIIYLRKNYHLCPKRISRFLDRNISSSSVYSVLKGNGMSLLLMFFPL